MQQRPPSPLPLQSYLVERYWPGATREAVAEAIHRLTSAATEIAGGGTVVRHVRSTFLPDEEAVFCIFEAESVAAIQEVNERAEFPLDRVSLVQEVPAEGSPG